MSGNDVSPATAATQRREQQQHSTGTVTCPSPALKAGDTTATVQVGSISRSYVLHVPSTYDGSKPVRWSWISTPSPARARRASKLTVSGADRSGRGGHGLSNWVGGPARRRLERRPCCVADVDDVAFAKALVTQVQRVACIDPKRVYAVGVSMGGGMAYYLACRAADVFAAIAPSAFDLMQEELVDCNPPRPITVISFRGTADKVVPYGGGLFFHGAGHARHVPGRAGNLQEMGGIDQCTDSPSAEDSNGCSSYLACQSGVEVILCTKQGGGQEAGNASVAWPVLRRHTL
jgi:polyhydroxybutyrate depolymerase